MKLLPVLPLSIVALVVAADQAIKWAVERFLPLHQPIDVIPYFSLFRTHNTGIAFSMLSDLGATGLTVVAVGVVVLVLALWSRTAAEYRIARIGFALIVGGAIGNLIDRALLGHVIDYVLFHTPSWSFAIFNLADASITTGAGLVLLDELIKWRAERREIAGKKPEPGD